MKKSLLVLLPLLTVALAGCNNNPAPTSGEGPTSAQPTTGPSTPSPTSGTSGTSVSPIEPVEHELPWLLEAEDCYLGDGYVVNEGDRDFDGTIVNLHNVNINKDPANTQTAELYTFQLAKQNHDKYPQGELTIETVKPSQVNVKVLVNSQYSWGSNQIGTVTFDGETIEVPNESESEPATDYSESWNIHSVTLDVNATEAGVFKISNTGKFAFYIISLEFVA